MKLPNRIFLLSLFCLFVGSLGCGKPVADQDSAGHHLTDAARHAHEPQNGGVPIMIGDEEFHLELVHEPGSQLMNAYVQDGHLEDYVRLEQPSFQMNIQLPTAATSLVFQAVADRATGETVGDTSLFQAEADWLKKLTSFDGVIPSIRIRSKTFENIEFSYPEGNEADHSH